MPIRISAALAAAASAGAVALAALAAAAPARAASVAYIDGHNVVLASPDGRVKRPLTADGTAETPYRTPAQGHDGRTVAVRTEEFDFGASKRPALHLFAPDGTRSAVNILPVYAGATAPVYPIGLDVDWGGQTVAYGYQYCGFACKSIFRGYWLTFSDSQGAYPSNPQGQSDALFPTFYGRRVVSSDWGGGIFVQPDVPEAPFTHAYQGWLRSDAVRLSRAELSAAGDLVALEWSARTGEGSGILVGRHQGTVPSDVSDLCALPVTGAASSVTFSPDGTRMAWQDADGVKVAGVPNLAAASEACSLSSEPVVLSPTGSAPSFGGADVAAAPAPGGEGAPGPAPAPNPAPAPGGVPSGGSAPGGAGAGAGGGSGAKPGTGTGTGTGTNTATAGASGGAPGRPAATLALTAPARVTPAGLRRGFTLRLSVPAAGRVDATATVPAAVARRLGLAAGRTTRPRTALGARATGFAAAGWAVVVARGRATARGAGPVTLTLKPTPAARRVARRLRGVRLAVRAGQGAATAAGTVVVTG